MARALSHDVRVIVMDEPSAVLDQEEVGRLFRGMLDQIARSAGGSRTDESAGVTS